jgi:CheY-like chemotaxis protein
MNDYGGYITVDTDPSKGTTFELYFPASESVATTDPPDSGQAGQSVPEPESSAGQNGMRDLIIVDDEEHIRRIFRLVLSSAFPDARIDTAVNGREAVDACRQHHYNVVVMDLRMPVMDGREAFSEIQSLYRKSTECMPSFVFCTGFAPPNVIQEIVGKNDDHCLLSKPVRSELLVSRVRTRLGI